VFQKKSNKLKQLVFKSFRNSFTLAVYMKFLIYFFETHRDIVESKEHIVFLCALCSLLCPYVFQKKSNKLKQLVFKSFRNSFTLAVDMKFLVNFFDVAAYRIDCDEHFGGDHFVAVAFY
jgi:hypothetical protein